MNHYYVNVNKETTIHYFCDQTNLCFSNIVIIQAALIDTNEIICADESGSLDCTGLRVFSFRTPTQLIVNNNCLIDIKEDQLAVIECNPDHQLSISWTPLIV